MTDWLLTNATPLRFGVFLLMAALLAGAEWRRPFRGVPSRRLRWGRHLLLSALGTLLLRFGLPMLAIGFGAIVDQQKIGLLQVYELPRWLACVLGVLVLDLAIYAQHRAFHVAPLLWRLHRMHHSDVHLDASSGIRFHPLEIALSMLIKIGVVVLFGIPALAVLVFEILLSASSLFTHADLRLPPGLESRLRRVLVTPEMHRIHHSVLRHETDSNFSNLLSVWDRLFKSYRAVPERDPAKMPIGIETFRDNADQRLLPLLVQPFRSPPPSG